MWEGKVVVAVVFFIICKVVSVLSFSYHYFISSAL